MENRQEEGIDYSEYLRAYVPEKEVILITWIDVIMCLIAASGFSLLAAMCILVALDLLI